MGWYVIALIALLGGAMVSRLGGRAIVVGIVSGAVVFVAGFIGPVIFMPNNNMGPMIGIFLGPVAFYVGGLGGFAWYAKRAFHSPPRERNIYFVVFVIFALSPVFLYALVLSSR